MWRGDVSLPTVDQGVRLLAHHWVTLTSSALSWRLCPQCTTSCCSRFRRFLICSCCIVVQVGRTTHFVLCILSCQPHSRPIMMLHFVGASADFSGLTQVQCTASLPLSVGGLGLRSATLTSQPAFWSSLGGLSGNETPSSVRPHRARSE